MFGELFRNPTKGNKVLYVHGEHTGRLEGCLPQKSGVLYTARLQSRLGLRLVILSGQRKYWLNIWTMSYKEFNWHQAAILTLIILVRFIWILVFSSLFSLTSGQGQGHSIQINNPISNIHVCNIIKPCTIPSGLYMHCNVWGCFTFIYCYMCLLTDRRIQGPASSRQADTYSWTLAVR